MKVSKRNKIIIILAKVSIVLFLALWILVITNRILELEENDKQLNEKIDELQERFRSTKLNCR